LEDEKFVLFSKYNELDKVVIVGGSNNARVWGRSPQPPKTNGGSETFFSKKNTHFKAYFGVNFCLKCVFK